MNATRRYSSVFCCPLWIAAIGTSLLSGSATAFAQQQSNVKDATQAEQSVLTESEEQAREDGEANDRNQPDPKLPELQTMIAVALEHNPDIRASRAKVDVAKAELDRTRLEVIQKLTTWRERYQAQKNALVTAEEELKLGKQAFEKGHVGQSVVFAAQKSAAARRSQLADLRAELPFLLGRPVEAFGVDGDRGKQIGTKASTSRRTELLKETIRPKLKEILKTTIEDLRVGRASVQEIYNWSRRLMEVERQLADTEAGQVAAIEAHRDVMQQVEGLAKRRLTSGGDGRLREVLAAQFYVDEAKLWLMEERNEE